MSDAARRLRAGFESGLAAVAPATVLARAIEVGPVLPAAMRVLAVGKAAAPMLRALRTLVGDRIVAALAVTPESGPHPEPFAALEALTATHPVPGDASAAAGRAALRFVAEGSAPLWVLLSGGTSSLLSTPLPPLDVAGFAALTDALHQSGADIHELNTVRRHASAAAGGRLAAAAAASGAPVRVLAISDVAGDDPSVIGSGPFAPDPSRVVDARRVVERRAASVRERLGGWPASAPDAETPKPGDPCFARVDHEIVAGNRDAVSAVARGAHRQGADALLLDEELVGEARAQGAALVARALAMRPSRRTWIVAGGETTVTVSGAGQGGRCQELALGAALALEGSVGVTLLAAGTDGIDGPTPAAGAIVDGDTVRRARDAGRDPAGALADNDAHPLLAASGDLLVTGPTGTNVRDLVILEIDP